MSTNEFSEIGAGVKALAATLAQWFGAPEGRADAAQTLQELALAVPASLEALTGLLNLANAAVLAPTGRPAEERLGSLQAAVQTALGVAMKACDLPAHGETSSRVDMASAALMQAILAYQAVDDMVEESAAPGEFQLLPADPDAELLGEFITECREYIHQSEAALLALEINPDDSESVNTVFRAFHTIKGTAGFVGLGAVAVLAHRAETLLSMVRDGSLRYTGLYADLALRSTDMLEMLMQSLEDALATGVAQKPDGYDDLLQDIEDPERETATPPLTMRLGDIVVGALLAERTDVEEALAQRPESPVGAALVESGVLSSTDAARAIRTQQRIDGDTRGVDATLRVRMDRLDKLIDTVGELVIAHSMVAQDETINTGVQHDLAKKVSHAGKLVRELQDLSMTMRMVPMRATFQKMGRLVRDLSHKTGKLVDLITEGEDTELDRNMVDAITDPLVHMVRNAADHGIESPDGRAAAGKPPRGTIRLSAYHAEGNVMVRIEDDGRGIDRERVVAKAMKQGLIDNADTLSDRQVFDLLFLPGFSTADRITDVSGRGVGMDVVRRNVENLGGQIDVQSTLGQGSVFSLRMPLTLAVTDGMLVRVGDHRYIIPIVSISMSFQPASAALTTVVGVGEMVRFRDRVLPVYRLHRLFEIEGAVEDPSEGLLVIVEDGHREYALLVDALLGQHQVVTKPLGTALGRVPGVAGTAILGDGLVGLILDVVGIGAMASEFKDSWAEAPEKLAVLV